MALLIMALTSCSMGLFCHAHVKLLTPALLWLPHHSLIYWCRFSDPTVQASLVVKIEANELTRVRLEQVTGRLTKAESRHSFGMSTASTEEGRSAHRAGARSSRLCVARSVLRSTFLSQAWTPRLETSCIPLATHSLSKTK